MLKQEHAKSGVFVATLWCKTAYSNYSTNINAHNKLNLNQWSFLVNKLSLAINKPFFILSYGLCAVLLLLGMYVKSLSLLALLSLLVVSSYLLLSISEHRKVIFYRQGIYYRNLFGYARYVPFEHIHNVNVLSILGFNVTQVRLTKGKRWFFAFTLTSAQLDQLAAIGYPLCDTTKACLQN